jgi:hypothetical protein
VALSAFDDPAHPPTADELETMLGPAAPLWTELVADVRRRAGSIDETWGFSGAKYGWSMRLVRGTRNLLYLTPQAGVLLVAAALGERAISTAEAAGLASARTIEVARAAPKYAEGRGVRLPVTSGEDLEVAKELARIKLGR